MIYLKISLSDFLTLFSARTRIWFWERRPGYALGVACIAATSTSTLMSLFWDDIVKVRSLTNKGSVSGVILQPSGAQASGACLLHTHHQQPTRSTFSFVVFLSVSCSGTADLRRSDVRPAPLPLRLRVGVGVLHPVVLRPGRQQGALFVSLWPLSAIM